jgi:hypothetical protein
MPICRRRRRVPELFVLPQMAECLDGGARAVERWMLRHSMVRIVKLSLRRRDWQPRPAEPVRRCRCEPNTRAPAHGIVSLANVRPLGCYVNVKVCQSSYRQRRDRSPEGSLQAEESVGCRRGWTPCPVPSLSAASVAEPEQVHSVTVGGCRRRAWRLPRRVELPAPWLNVRRPRAIEVHCAF